MKESFRKDVKTHFQSSTRLEKAALICAVLVLMMWFCFMAYAGGLVGYYFIEPKLAKAIFSPGAGTAMGGGIGVVIAWILFLRFIEGKIGRDC